MALGQTHRSAPTYQGRHIGLPLRHIPLLGGVRGGFSLLEGEDRQAEYKKGSWQLTGDVLFLLQKERTHPCPSEEGNTPNPSQEGNQNPYTSLLVSACPR